MNRPTTLSPMDSKVHIQEKVIQFYGQLEPYIIKHTYFDPDKCIGIMLQTTDGTEKILNINSCIVCPHGNVVRTRDKDAWDGYGVKCTQLWWAISIEAPWKYGWHRQDWIDSLPIPDNCPLKK